MKYKWVKQRNPHKYTWSLNSREPKINRILKAERSDITYKSYSIRLATDLSIGTLKEMLKCRKKNVVNPQE